MAPGKRVPIMTYNNIRASSRRIAAAVPWSNELLGVELQGMHGQVVDDARQYSISIITLLKFRKQVVKIRVVYPGPNIPWKSKTIIHILCISRKYHHFVGDAPNCSGMLKVLMANAGGSLVFTGGST